MEESKENSLCFYICCPRLYQELIHYYTVKTAATHRVAVRDAGLDSETVAYPYILHQ